MLRWFWRRYDDWRIRLELKRWSLPPGVTRRRQVKLALVVAAIVLVVGVLGPILFGLERWVVEQTAHDPLSLALGPVSIIVIGVIIGLLLGIAAFLLFQPGASPSQKGPAAATEVGVPGNDENRPIAEIYGRRLVTLNLIAYGNLRPEKIKRKVDGGKEGDKKIHVGWSYRLDMVWAIGGVVDKLLEFRKRNDPTFKGSLDIIPPDQAKSFFAQTGTATPTNGSGTGKSQIVFVDGRQFDRIDSVYKRLTGFPIINLGVSYLSMNAAFIGDNTTSVEAYQVLVEHNLTTEYPWSTSVDGDASAVAVVYDILVRHLGISTSLIDLPSFNAADATLASESVGISFVMNTQSEAVKWINTINEHIDGVLYYDEEVGKFKYRLIRDDYDPDLLDVIDEQRYKKLRIERDTWESVYTDVEVKWVDRHTWKLRPYRMSNNANRRLIGQKKSKEIIFPFFTREASVAHALARVERRSFTPLARATCDLSELDLKLNPGDVIKINSERGNFQEAIYRVMGVGGGKSSDQKYAAEMTEDLFGLGSVEIGPVPDGGTEDIDYIITELEEVDIFDALPENVNTPSPTVVPVAVPKVGEFVQGFNFYASNTNGTFDEGVENGIEGEFQVSGRGTLVSDLPGGHNKVRIDQIQLENGLNIFDETLTEEQWLRGRRIIVFDGRGLVDPGGDFEKSDFSIYAVREIIDNGGGDFTLNDLICVYPQHRAGGFVHAAGTVVWVLPFRADEAEKAFINRANIKGWFHPFNTIQFGDETGLNYDYGFTAETPYAVARLEGTRVVNDVDLTWDACEPRKGPVALDPDTFPANDGAPNSGLSWRVQHSGGLDTIVTTPAYSTVDAVVRTYEVSQLFNGREGRKKTITI